MKKILLMAFVLLLTVNVLGQKVHTPPSQPFNENIQFQCPDTSEYWAVGVNHFRSLIKEQFTGFGLYGHDSTPIRLYLAHADEDHAPWNSGKGLYIDVTGNVGIGTLNPGSFKLAVQGKIGAHEVIVTTERWADFVFDDTYDLTSLAELKAFIKTNKHLPEIPTAEEVGKKGVSVGEMNAKLLQKIEELTLYTLQQQEVIEALLYRVEQLENK